MVRSARREIPASKTSLSGAVHGTQDHAERPTTNTKLRGESSLLK